MTDFLQPAPRVDSGGRTFFPTLAHREISEKSLSDLSLPWMAKTSQSETHPRVHTGKDGHKGTRVFVSGQSTPVWGHTQTSALLPFCCLSPSFLTIFSSVLASFIVFLISGPLYPSCRRYRGGRLQVRVTGIGNAHGPIGLCPET